MSPTPVLALFKYYACSIVCFVLLLFFASPQFLILSMCISGYNHFTLCFRSQACFGMNHIIHGIFSLRSILDKESFKTVEQEDRSTAQMDLDQRKLPNQL